MKAKNVPECTESLTIKPQVSLAETTDDLMAEDTPEMETIKSRSRSSERESVTIAQQDQLQSTGVIADSIESEKTQIKTTKIRDKRRPVSVSRHEELEGAEVLQSDIPKDQNKIRQKKPKHLREKKEAIAIMKPTDLESTSSLVSEETSFEANESLAETTDDLIAGATAEEDTVKIGSSSSERESLTSAQQDQLQAAEVMSGSTNKEKTQIDNKKPIDPRRTSNVTRHEDVESAEVLELPKTDTTEFDEIHGGETSPNKEEELSLIHI